MWQAWKVSILTYEIKIISEFTLCLCVLAYEQFFTICDTLRENRPYAKKIQNIVMGISMLSSPRAPICATLFVAKAGQSASNSLFQTTPSEVALKISRL